MVLLMANPAFADDPQWAGDTVVIDEIIVQVEKGGEPDFDWSSLARDIMAVKRGDILSAQRLEQTETALKAFADIKTQVRTSPRGARLTFVLTPYRRIKSIDFSGAYPLFERDLRSLMSVAPGDVFNPPKLTRQADLIAQRYQAEGYIDPRVQITWEEAGDDGHMDVAIDIHKGDAYDLGDLRLTGNRAIADTLLKAHMATWRRAVVRLGTTRLVTARLKEDIQNLVTYYRSQGFADVRITAAVQHHPKRKKADVQITIDEGPRYRITFEGQRHFSEKKLKAELALSESGNRGNMGLRRSVQNIRRRYLKAGFANVRVQWEQIPSEDNPGDERQVRFKIQEGRRHIVRQVTIAGNSALGTKAIQAQMLTRPANGLGNGAYIATVLQEDATAIEALYHQDGYLHARVATSTAIDEKTAKVDVSVTIEEGPRTRIGSITIEGDRPLPTEQLLKAIPLNKGSVLQPQKVESGENELAARIAAKGYPHVVVKGRLDFSADRSVADIVYLIDAGPYVEVGRIFWAGNFRTRDKLLRREINLVQGTPFSLAKVLEAQRRLRDLDLFQSVQVRSIGLKEKASRVHLFVTLVEKTSYYVELGAGYQTDKGVYGRIKAGDRNFLGLKKELHAGGEVSGIGYRWDADFVEPRFLSLNLRADLGLFVERREEFNQDFGTDTSGGKITFSRPWGQRLTTALGVRYERRQQFLRDSNAASSDVDPEALEPRALWVTTPVIRYDSRDSFIRPHAGNLANLAVDISKGLDSSLDNFIKYKLDLRTYYTPRQRLTLAGRALAGYIQPYGVDGEIPEDQLFFLGGTAEVRGFEENLLRFDSAQNPVGGRLALAGSLEARYEMTPAWELTLFVDAGSIQKSPSENEGDDRWRWTYGLGLRYITPIGPMGLLYGQKVDPLPGESRGQLHFSIGYTF